ncbi:MAG: sulfatase-like hydrolase/transferase [Paracoccaceae bacterium]|nr:sulfatase-like hydrolase/transferase [Paracoccaceae bacterium]
MKKNILFIMYDQLRFDYLSCYGHKHLKTPNFDKVASKGVRFTNAYVQSPVCGASRMSTYTGRYVASHGAAWNKFPLRVGEPTLGDHLRQIGMDCWLLGKTHMEADEEGMARLGIEKGSIIGIRQKECGFDPWARDDGLHGHTSQGQYGDKESPYNNYLKSKGYDGENPWADYANASINNGRMASGWFIENADKPANIAEQDSETPWLTREAVNFIDEVKGPWCAHISFIKPHWPYIVPAPYNDMFGPEHVQPLIRDDKEREDPNPVYQAFFNNKIAKTFQNDEARSKALVAYMGLIKQCDDQLGVILDHLEKTGKDKNTVIVLTSDHGDYLGDHWLGEKDLFHQPSVKVPLIVYDPDPKCDETRNTVCNSLVEQIDLAPTFIEMAGGESPIHILEGRSLIPLLHGKEPNDWRQYVISEYDYSVLPMRHSLNLESWEARLFMVFDGRYKLMHSASGHQPMLFDLDTDPNEFNDLGKSKDHKLVIEKLYKQLHEWSLRMSQRVTMSEAHIAKKTGQALKHGILVGVHLESDVAKEFTTKYTGPARQVHFERDEDRVRYAGLKPKDSE